MPTLNDIYAHDSELFKPAKAYRGLLPGTSIDMGYANIAPTVIEVRNALKGISADPQRFYDLKDRINLANPLNITEFTTRKNSVSKITFLIKSRDGKNEKVIEQATEDLNKVFKKAKKLNQEAILMGIKPAEIIWNTKGSRTTISGFKPLRKDQFFWVDGELHWSDIPGMSTRANPLSEEQLLHLYAPTFFMEEPERDRDYYGGLFKYAAMITAMQFYVIWNTVKLSGKYGKPQRIGKYPQGAPKADVDVLKSAIFDLGEDLGAVFPEDMMIELQEFKGMSASADMAENLIHRLDGYITKLYNGTTLATTAEKYGTRAQADSQDEVRSDYFEDDLEHNENCLQDLLNKWWWMNISRTEECPLYVENDYKEKEDLVKLSVVIGNLKNAGAGKRIPAKFINEKFEIPEPEEGEETLGETDPLG